MPTDATGTPTSLGIPTFNVDVDEPSGLGFNEAMAIIDSLLVARSGVSSFVGRTGNVTANTGDYTAAKVTNAADLSNVSPQTFSGQVKAPQFAAIEIGSGAALVGSTTSGAPTTGTWSVGNFVIDYTGAIWVCTGAGTPGTWKSISTVASVFGRTGAVTAQTGDYTAAQVTNAADKASAATQVFNAVVEPTNLLYPCVSLTSNTLTPIVDQSGSLEAFVGGLSGAAVTVNNPGHFPASGTMFLFSITLVCNAINNVTGISWGNSYKFGSHTSNVAIAQNQSFTWLFIMDGTSNKAICVGESGLY